MNQNELIGLFPPPLVVKQILIIEIYRLLQFDCFLFRHLQQSMYVQMINYTKKTFETNMQPLLYKFRQNFILKKF